MKGNWRHGHDRKGKRTPEYRAWVGMKSRCYIPSQKGYDKYHGKGISVCKRWLTSFHNFLDDMGLRPSDEHSLDRINNDGNYEPSNCRWATRREQCLNRVYKLTPLDVQCIRTKASIPQKRLAAQFGITQSAVSKILSGKEHPYAS